MKLYTLTAVTALLSGLLALPAGAAGAAGGYAPLTPMSQCLDPDRIRTWHFIDSDEVLIDAGRRHFLLQLSTACPELTHAWQVGFRSGNSVGRICGNLGDAVIGVGRSTLRLPCRIATVTPLDEQQYDREMERGRPGQRGVVSVRGEDDRSKDDETRD